MNKQDIDKNVTKGQVILLRDKFNNDYNFVPFLSLQQKSVCRGSAIGKVTSVGNNFKYADKSITQEMWWNYNKTDFLWHFYQKHES